MALRRGRGSARWTNCARGSVLCVVLWFTACVGAMSLAMGQQVGQIVKGVARCHDRAAVRMAVWRSVERARQVLLEDMTASREVSERAEESSGRWLGRRGTQPVDGGAVECEWELLDEQSRINLNTASTETLSRVPGLDALRAEAIVRAREARRERLRDAASADAASTGETAEIRPFKSVRDAVFAADMDEEALALAEPFLTTSGDGTVHINTASVEALTAVGLGGETAEKTAAYCHAERGARRMWIRNEADVDRIVDLTDEARAVVRGLFHRRVLSGDTAAARVEVTVRDVVSREERDRAVAVFSRRPHAVVCEAFIRAAR